MLLHRSFAAILGALLKQLGTSKLPSLGYVHAPLCLSPSVSAQLVCALAKNHRPMAKCTRFSQIWSNQPTYHNAAASSCDAHVLGSERGVTFWRPQAPIGYAVLGDCITAGSTQPTFQVALLPACMNRLPAVLAPAAKVLLWNCHS